MFLKRLSNLTMGAAIVIAVVSSSAPVWCEDATKQEKNLVLLKQIEADLVKRPGDLDLQVRHMQALGVAGRNQDQLREAEILISKHPHLRDACKGQMFALIGLRNWSGAMTAIEQVRKLGPLSQSELTVRGIILTSLGRYREALNDLNESLSRDSSDAGAYFCRAECLYKLHGATSEVVHDLEQTLKLDPDCRNAQKLLDIMKGRIADSPAIPAR
jgi:tetratricopeptide (TPR) repeat protein